jgi:methionine-rich copper-binding protein CopC
MKRVYWLLAAAIIAVALGASPAFAHGDLKSTNPAKDSKVKKVPLSVSAIFTEPPTQDSVLDVVDGCGDKVGAHVAINGDTVTAHIVEAQPGDWTASYRVVSAIDGHLTEGSWKFSVAGKADCSAKASGNTEGTKDGANSDGSGQQDVSNEAQASSESTSDDSSFPIIPVAIGAVVLIGIAAAVRLGTAR